MIRHQRQMIYLRLPWCQNLLPARHTNQALPDADHSIYHQPSQIPAKLNNNTDSGACYKNPLMQCYATAP